MKKHIILCAVAASVILTFTGCEDKKQIDETTNKSEAVNKQISDKEVNSSDKQVEEQKGKKSEGDNKNQEGSNRKQGSLSKKKYIDKLNTIEGGIKKDFPNSYSDTTVKMKEALGEAYKRWDDALNEIYGDLKKELKPDVMKELKNEQINWITYRDNTAKKESQEFKGGTLEGVQYIESMGRVTKERCYELVDKYMR